MWQVIVWAKFCEILIERSMRLQLTPLFTVRNSAPNKVFAVIWKVFQIERTVIFLSDTSGAASENSALVYY